MLSTRDSNAERIIQIITNELVRHASKSSSSSRVHSVTWDQIIRVWNVIVLKPNITEAEVLKFEGIITLLAKNEHLPETEEYEEPRSENQAKRAKLTFKSIFSSTLKFLKHETNHHDHEVMRLHSRYCHGMEDESSL
ncbi:hypothetical protein Ocin01_12206 [Orchesella cincta]|uniref:Uncharacterized protein n=1 Tax=Orchesella cincta TaxID=48709 RepID=A0A1D2MN28_ORCCI|nr:hypothetical protein Ocin01_12206 [Orchesella cincta]